MQFRKLWQIELSSWAIPILKDKTRTLAGFGQISISFAPVSKRLLARSLFDCFVILAYAIQAAIQLFSTTRRKPLRGILREKFRRWP